MEQPSTSGTTAENVTRNRESSADGVSALHDVLAEGGDRCHQLLMLSWWHLVLVKGLLEVANNNGEFGVGDPEPGVHRLRRTADHLAWASGNIAHQVLVLLFEHFAGVRAHTDKVLANSWIRGKSASGHVTTVDKQFREARRAAGLPENLVLYSARHDFGTRLLQKTGNLAAVMRV